MHLPGVDICLDDTLGVRSFTAGLVAIHPIELVATFRGSKPQFYPIAALQHYF
jgi:hypothetical protein